MDINKHHEKDNMNALAELKATDTDFEFYPTTDAIINAFHQHAHQFEISSLLDIGAGNGKVLLKFDALTKQYERPYRTEFYAMEKSLPLLDSLPIDISILGTDFWEQSLIDKSVDCIFSNPPYSEFVNWCVKLIREANSNFIYLVIPQRWKTQQVILDALKSRQAEAEVIGEFDFLEAEDRKARAKVDLIFIQLREKEGMYSRRGGRANYENAKVDPFTLWVSDYFGISPDVNKDTLDDWAKKEQEAKQREEKISHALVTGEDLIQTLHALYCAELENLLNNYKKVCSLDAALFLELNISLKSVVNSLKTRINGLKNAYWLKLFNNYEPLTSRLTKASREAFSRSINEKTNIDFTPSNAYAITVWAIKNANTYFDKQMIDTYEKMAELANVINYKSNERVFTENRWRYNNMNEAPSHYKLDYRIVLQRVGGIDTTGYSSYGRNGLRNEAANFIDDLITIAHNLGFNKADSMNGHSFRAGENNTFYCKCKSGDLGEFMTLMDVKAFKNGNLHIKLNQQFALAMNVEVGRLLGWVHNAQHAAQEMDENVGEVVQYYRTTYTALPSAINQLLLAA